MSNEGKLIKATGLLGPDGRTIIKKVYFRWATEAAIKENEISFDAPAETAELIIKSSLAVDKLCMVHTKDKHTGKIAPILCLKVEEDNGTKVALLPLARLLTKDYMKYLEPPQRKPKGQLDE